jgi:glycosyltransferase involved in cell wall biosynthesis
VFLVDPPDGYEEAAEGIAESVEFIGRLEHDEVAKLLPGAEALVMPSTFPEAFGMVAAEAAACGVLPVSAGHSGMLEVSRELAATLPPEAAELVSFPVEVGAVEAIADRLNRWLALPEAERVETREALVATARRLWSWEGVARGVLAACGAEGPENLPPPLQ